MRQGRVFRRCGRCSRAVEGGARSCASCGHDRHTWAYVVDLAPPGAPREQKLKAGFATKRAALAALHDAQSAAAQGAYVKPRKMTVGEYLNDWLPSARARLRPSAYDACELHVRCYITPRIGTMPLQALDSKKVKRLYADLASSGRARGGGGLSTKTVHNIHRTLSRALRDAVDERLVPRNAAQGAHRQPDSPEQPSWTAVQLRRFLHNVATDRLFAMWRVAATTGVRRGELIALRWSDVDLDAGRLAVVQQRSKGGGTVAAGPTKSKRGRRLLSLDPETVDALRRHAEAQVKEKEFLGRAYHDEGLVFCRPDGKPIHPDRVTQMFRDHVKAAGLPWIKVHGLRHTHATLMLKANVHPKVVQERLGHSSIAITLDTYSHAIPAMQEDAASRVALLIDTDAEAGPDEQ